jgi:hypothetical protein
MINLESCRKAFDDFGLGEWSSVEILRQRQGHRIYRIWTVEGSWILKCFQPNSNTKEVQVYRMLHRYEVPTLPFQLLTENALLLLDLDQSETWRRADLEDMHKASTGKAVADWYKKLHAVGRMILCTHPQDMKFLEPWVDVIQPQILEEVGHKLEIAEIPCWKLGITHCEEIIAKYKSFPQTFNYSDFAAENLAFVNKGGACLQAIVFDYDQFSIGTVCSDWRNVVYSLRGEALVTFKELYGRVSDREHKLDAVLSVQYGLIVAAGRIHFPDWGVTLRDLITTDTFSSRVQAALHV